MSRGNVASVDTGYQKAHLEILYSSPVKCNKFKKFKTRWICICSYQKLLKCELLLETIFGCFSSVLYLDVLLLAFVIISFMWQRNAGALKVYDLRYVNFRAQILLSIQVLPIMKLSDFIFLSFKDITVYLTCLYKGLFQDL